MRACSRFLGVVAAAILFAGCSNGECVTDDDCLTGVCVQVSATGYAECVAFAIQDPSGDVGIDRDPDPEAPDSAANDSDARTQGEGDDAHCEECVVDCPPGYELSDGKCADVDECVAGLDDCFPAPGGTCVNTAHGYECQCASGWAGDGRVCDRVVAPEGVWMDTLVGEDFLEAVVRGARTDATTLAFVASGTTNADGGADSVASITGLGLAWSKIEEQCASDDMSRVEVWLGQGVPDVNGEVRVTFLDFTIRSMALLTVLQYDNGGAISSFVGRNSSGGQLCVWGAGPQPYGPFRRVITPSAPNSAFVVALASFDQAPEADPDSGDNFTISSNVVASVTSPTALLHLTVASVTAEPGMPHFPTALELSFPNPATDPRWAAVSGEILPSGNSQ